MSTSQSVRYAPFNPSDPVNPSHIVKDITDITTQLFGAGAPAVSLGIIGNVYTDVTTGFQYQKHDSGWDPTIALGSFAVIPDPLALNELDVNIIKGNATQSLQVNLQTTGALSIGPAAALSRVRVLSDGSIITNSATSTVIVADGGGNQTGYGPQSIVSDNLMNVTSQNAMQFNSNTADISLNPATDLTLNPGGVVHVTQQILSTGLGPQYADAAGTSGLQVGPGLATLKGFGGGQITAFSGGLSTTGNVYPINPSVYNIGDNTGNKFLDVASDNAHFSNTFLDNGLAATPSYTFKSSTNDGLYLAAPGQVSIAAGGAQMLQVSSNALFIGSAAVDGPSGVVGTPGYSFAGDTTSGLYLNGAGNPVMAASGAAVMGWVSGQTNSMASIVPTANNTYDLGTATPLAWRNIYSNNLLNVVSDERRKKNIEALAPGLDLIENLCPVSYQFKDGSDDRYKIGFIAQSTDVVMKEYDKDYDVVNYDVPNDSYTMKYDSLIGVLVKAVQELSAQVKELKSTH